MADDVQLPEPAADLLRVADGVAADWLRRTTAAAARRGGIDPATIALEIDEVARTTARDLLDELRALLATDVDEQRTNPLSVFRGAVAAPTELLRRHGAAPRSADPFDARAFPDDPYRLGPASWADVDDELHAPGITWGAWKAMTILQRRRDEGLR